MSLPTPKELKKLAKACRDAGISHFRSGDFEFTLGEAPVKPSYKRKNAPQTSVQGEIESDAPDEESLLFWSVGLPQDALNSGGGEV